MNPLATVTITAPRDRTKPGQLVLRNIKGETIFSCQCLLRSVGHASNPTRDPLKFRGDTPLGKYETTFVSHLPQKSVGVGDLWVGLDPANFYDTPARRAEIAGRTRLGIHGGRGDGMLKATHGCVRLLDRDMADFARVAGKLRFTVEIQEAR